MVAERGPQLFANVKDELSFEQQHSFSIFEKAKKSNRVGRYLVVSMDVNDPSIAADSLNSRFDNIVMFTGTAFSFEGVVIKSILKRDFSLNLEVSLAGFTLLPEERPQYTKVMAFVGKIGKGVQRSGESHSYKLRDLQAAREDESHPITQEVINVIKHSASCAFLAGDSFVMRGAPPDPGRLMQIVFQSEEKALLITAEWLGLAQRAKLTSSDVSCEKDLVRLVHDLASSILPPDLRSRLRTCFTSEDEDPGGKIEEWLIQGQFP